MKYISKNFENKEVKLLTATEIEVFSTMLTFLKGIDSIDCVALVPFEQTTTKYKDPNGYSLQLMILMNDIDEGYEVVDSFVSNVSEILEQCSVNKVGFIVDNFNTQRDLTAAASMYSIFVSSYILFDRNGEYAKAQEELSGWLGTIDCECQSLVALGNIDSLEVNSSKRTRMV